MLLTIFYGCTARFVSDMVENAQDRFSHDTAHKVKTAIRLTPIINQMPIGHNAHLNAAMAQQKFKAFSVAMTTNQNQSFGQNSYGW